MPGAGGVVGGSRRTAWSSPSRSSSIRVARASVRGATSPALSHPSMLRISRENTRRVVGRAIPNSVSSTRASKCSVRSPSSASFLDRPATAIRAVRDFCKTRGTWAWVVSRIDDCCSCISRHVGDEPGLELDAELDEQPFDGPAEVIARLRQHVQRGRLVVGRRPGRGFAETLLGRPHRGAGADQVFSQGDAGVSQPGRGLCEPIGRAAVLGLIPLAAPEFGLGDRSLGLHHLIVQAGELLAQAGQGPYPRRATAALESAPSREVTASARSGIGPPQMGGLKVREQRVGRQSGYRAAGVSPRARRIAAHVSLADFSPSL